MSVCVVSLADIGVISYQHPGNFRLLLFFVRITFHVNNKLTARSILATTTPNCLHTPNPPLYHLLSQLQRVLRRRSGSSRISGWGLLNRQRSEIWSIVQGREEAGVLVNRWWGVSRMWWGRISCVNS